MSPMWPHEQQQQQQQHGRVAEVAEIDGSQRGEESRGYWGDHGVGVGR